MPQKKAQSPKQKATATVQKQEYKKEVTVTGSVFELSVQIISRHEGFHYKAYHDRTRYSIGFGTKSYAGEVITYEEGIKRFHEALDRRTAQVKREHPTLKNHERAALTSLLYNCPSCYKRTLHGGITRSDFIRVALAGTKYEGGLKKRADNERALFTLGVIY